jgi:hypothetical protein
VFAPLARVSNQTCNYGYDVAPMFRACPRLRIFYAYFSEGGGCSAPPASASSQPLADLDPADEREMLLTVRGEDVGHLPQVVAHLPRTAKLEIASDAPAWTVGLLASLLPGLPRLRTICVRERHCYEVPMPPPTAVGSLVRAAYFDLAAAVVVEGPAQHRLEEFRFSPLHKTTKLARLVRAIQRRVPECRVRWTLPDDA